MESKQLHQEIFDKTFVVGVPLNDAHPKESYLHEHNKLSQSYERPGGKLEIDVKTIESIKVPAAAESIAPASLGILKFTTS